MTLVAGRTLAVGSVPGVLEMAAQGWKAGFVLDSDHFGHAGVLMERVVVVSSMALGICVEALLEIRHGDLKAKSVVAAAGWADVVAVVGHAAARVAAVEDSPIVSDDTDVERASAPFFQRAVVVERRVAAP